jgi:hypothetical protein
MRNTLTNEVTSTFLPEEESRGQTP